MTKDKRPYKIIDLSDYAKKEKFTFDYSDWNWSSDFSFSSLKEADSHYLPEYRFPKNFSEEEKLECLNHAYRRADEDASMCGYIDYFHGQLLDVLNNNEEKLVSFEYEEDCWDSIKLRVYYDISFLVGGVSDGDEDNSMDVEDYLYNFDFDGCISSARSRCERYCDRDDKVFTENFKECLSEQIEEVKSNRRTLYSEIKKIITNKEVTEKKKIMWVLKKIETGG